MYPKFQIKTKNKEGERCRNQDQNSCWRNLEEGGAGSLRPPPASGSGGGRSRSPSDDGEAQSEELRSFLWVFLRALRRFLSNAPEQRGHVPSVNSDEDRDDDDDNNIHCEGYKQHRSDAARQTFTVSLFVRSPEVLHRRRTRKKEDGIVWQHWLSVMESRTRPEKRGRQMTMAAMVVKRGGQWTKLGRVFFFFFLIRRHKAPVLRLLTSASLALEGSGGRKQDGGKGVGLFWCLGLTVTNQTSLVTV